MVSSLSLAFTNHAPTITGSNPVNLQVCIGKRDLKTMRYLRDTARWRKKAQNNPRSAAFLREPKSPAGQFSRSKTVPPPRLCPAKMRGGRGRAPSPWPTPFAAAPRRGGRRDFQGVRGRFKEGCLDRLRRCGHTVTWNFLSREMLMPKVFS